MSSPKDITLMLRAESEKLDSLVKSATSQEPSIHEIVEMYYQAINISSIITMLKQESIHIGIVDSISEAERKISDFNKMTHPKILAELKTSIAESIKILKASSDSQSKNETENAASDYELLRKKMSTKEFVEQYDRELK
ncbi:MAG: hypothetical protein OXC46_01405 [Thaumarchaeota archaeon]|nr:hypothetical protein [Nitrososphaerota archaeon]